MRDDPLQGLSQRDRRMRIAADVAYLQANGAGAATEEAQTIARAIGGIELGIYKPDPVADQVVVCSRVDLDTPVFFPDNIIIGCADCGCDVQVRPDVRAELKRVCVCCGARRLREERAKA